ncbi:hypothetical protein TorRG33x02_020450 [Trema orientale]|uniref:Uncharacterized protein n=1 Tax=Trema orientale TaxID=63057 RepID=A0A2P5FWT1_TREOI|nr:hypothetical protein TorRG33x02_020450 [Trema orientale]
MPSNHNGSWGELNTPVNEMKWTTVNESKAHHVIANKNHGVSTMNPPHHFLTLQHKIDPRHVRSVHRAPDIERAKARAKRRHRRNPRNTESFDECVNHSLVYGSFQHRVRINVADLRSAVTVFVEGQQRRIQWHGLSTDLN